MTNKQQSHFRACVEPVPPNEYLKRSEHHWLEKLDTDGHSFGLYVAQWNPGARRWSHSGAYGTGIYLNTECWQYVAHCPMPNIEKSIKEVTLLRNVYDCARQLVRFYGIDKERSIAAGAALDTAIEAVKNFDGGTDEQED